MPFPQVPFGKEALQFDITACSLVKLDHKDINYEAGKKRTFALQFKYFLHYLPLLRKRRWKAHQNKCQQIDGFLRNRGFLPANNMDSA